MMQLNFKNQYNILAFSNFKRLSAADISRWTPIRASLSVTNGSDTSKHNSTLVPQGVEMASRNREHVALQPPSKGALGTSSALWSTLHMGRRAGSRSRTQTRPRPTRDLQTQ